MKKLAKHPFSLRDEPFFRDMSPATLGRIEQFVYHREYEPRQVVYFPDDVCDYAYWVRTGRVKVTRTSDDGRELTFRLLLPGDTMGEECLVDLRRRNAYAQAMESTVLCLMRADDFRRFAREEQEFCLTLAKRLCLRAVETEQVLSETVFKSVRSRIASGLLRLYYRVIDQEGATLRVTHQELASLTGTTRETTTTVLHGLREEGMLSIGNRRLTVLDPVRLEHAARSG